MSDTEGELPGASPGGHNAVWDFTEKLPEDMTLEWRIKRSEPVEELGDVLSRANSGFKTSETRGHMAC